MKKEKFKYRPEKREFQTSNEEYKAYRDAVWHYLIEHCDIVTGGAMFVKFHTRDRGSFESHVESRMNFNYHREDPVEKQAEIQRRKDKLSEVKKINEDRAEARRRENPRKRHSIITRVINKIKQDIKI